MNFTRNLIDITRDDIPIAGGKGANLGELLRAGLPIPPGFVLLTTAYKCFVESNSLQAEIDQLANQVTPQNPASAEQASQAIRKLFERGTLPDEISQAVLSAYHQLVTIDTGAVAVRSSATAEDLPGASFAGQHDTSLNIQTPAKLLHAIRQCWSSLWTPRALIYRSSHSIDPHSLSLAVVVQEMIQASASGVLFTVNPVTGARDQLVINATSGR